MVYMVHRKGIKQKKNCKYVEPRENLLINAENFYDGREIIIDAFKNKIFPMTPTGFSENEAGEKSSESEKS